DVNASNVAADDVRAASCANILGRTAAFRDQSVLYCGRDDDPISEFSEPRFLELAFPCLFPYGRGGFDFTRVFRNRQANNGRQYRDSRISPAGYTDAPERRP